ncbi:hypothetical protein EN904_13690 [Mesorhizobium sp. M7A.F.Ca.CA.001.07.2.1]|nr:MULTISPECIES: DUF6065 family protein [Mesorhizobium]MCQ8815213.1 DUF6065 family protein [Mesorhizobium sp. SEMIA396]RUX14621.1 hypothetical protein EN996_15900 [Mesorhizobium sp. M7A.F.Ca.CA.002.14.1.2]RUX62344.1 hypothetical protein EN994_01210 [Mesorhizobium sp. M7A.F.Ca.CA.002.09.1.1]RUX88204.1 hypothetical protein EN982_07785 [Mesorhizobium sp. M7A.F.Ca.CA.004.08.1.1]RUY49191.1 hypothetical protein EN972_01035 [Mesorhizobium sp. M7A.F.Ca.CA.002.07.1.1]RUY86419.1 hypothetical protein EN
MTGPRLDCMIQAPNPPELVAAEGTRDWMDATDQHFAYRCTPLSIANASGWELLNPINVTVTWNGYNTTKDIAFHVNEPNVTHRFISSTFGHGIVTFHPGYVFRTEPGWMVWARGSPNRMKDGIAPLDGLVETNWLPFSFTMNWRFTRPGSVTFAKGEPFCFITMMPSVAIEQVQPVIRPMEDDPEFHKEHKVWNSERRRFSAGLQMNDELTKEMKWQKHYLQGVSPTGKSVADDTHRVKRTLKRPIHIDQLRAQEKGSPVDEASQE